MMSIKEMDQEAKKKHRNHIRRFLRDMKKAGLLTETRYYEGRSFWTGPATSCDSLQEVLSQTKVTCQWDQMGKGYIVYPQESLGMK